MSIFDYICFYLVSQAHTPTCQINPRLDILNLNNTTAPMVLQGNLLYTWLQFYAKIKANVAMIKIRLEQQSPLHHD